MMPQTAAATTGRSQGLVVICLIALGLVGCGKKQETPGRAQFNKALIDGTGLADPWGKGIGDVNDDGRLDVVVGSRGGDGLVWYENPGWRRHVISASGAWSTDVAIADVDGDGISDVVAIGKHDVTGGNEGLVLFKGPDWVPRALSRKKLHDISIADLDGNGRLDIVGRGQSAFGAGGDVVYVHLQRPDGSFGSKDLSVEAGEGLAVGDLDQDGSPDIVLNGAWLRNPGSAGGEWAQQSYTKSWTWPHVVVAVGDVDGDGRPDIVLTPAELEGQRYRIAWFEQPAVLRGPTDWAEHVIAADVEAVHHSLVLADFDRDGRLDLATAMMQQGRKPQVVSVYLNDGLGRAWTREILSREGSHNMVGADLDADGDVDLVGANWSGSPQPIQLWRNMTCSPERGCPRWRRHEIDGARPGPAAFVVPKDLDGDGLVDVGSGAWWYKNPGRPAGQWVRRSVAGGGSDLALLSDLDGDEAPDALSVRWPSDGHPAKLLLARNDGNGNFRVETGLPPVAGDFLQGVAIDRFDGSGLLQVALSWHKPGQGVQLLSVPVPGSTGSSQGWRLETISDLSQDEALTAGDIDGDGRPDLLQGTAWLRNTPTGWQRHWIEEDAPAPDRNRLGDINGDGRLDAVVGFEAISKPGALVWYEQGADSLMPWRRHEIATVVGPMSLDVADFDGDGALDVVVGEHNLVDPASARLILFFNKNGDGLAWGREIVHEGDEHHDGAVAVDLDGDGDLDIVSIGWGHDKVIWYEHLSRPVGGRPGAHRDGRLDHSGS